MTAPIMCPCDRVPIPLGALSAVERLDGRHSPAWCEVDGLVVLAGETLADAVAAVERVAS